MPLKDMLLAAATDAATPFGPLGACVIAGAVVVLIAYMIGFVERQHWGGRPPTPQEYLHGKRKMGRVQYSTSQWSQRVLIASVAVLAVGIALLAYGLAA